MKNGNVISTINRIVEEIKKFSTDLYTINPPVLGGFIEKFENEFQVELPIDYKYLLSLTNGFDLMGSEIYGIKWADYGEDLVSAYKYEHFETIMPQFKHLIPFSPDGGGNFYCFDTSVKTIKGNSNRIVFWYSNYEYTELDPPEITHECFCDFLNECILGWTLEDYNYDGSKKR